jgi:hypothetical protein
MNYYRLLEFLFAPFILVFKNIQFYLRLLKFLIIPILIFYCMGYLMLFMFSFVFWKLPDTLPIPFYTNLMFDRVLMILGFTIWFCMTLNEKK